MIDLPERITYGDKYGPAMKITDQAEADEYFDLCVRHAMRFGKSREEAEQIERNNLGYFAGYYDNETRFRVERLFSCAHPIFGPIAQKGPPATEEAWWLGYERGRALRPYPTLANDAPATKDFSS